MGGGGVTDVGGSYGKRGRGNYGCGVGGGGGGGGGGQDQYHLLWNFTDTSQDSFKFMERRVELAAAVLLQ